MKNMSAKISLAAIAALGTVSGFVTDAHAAVVINEVYGGGGATATTGSYSTDFIELYNNGLTNVDLTGLTVRYGSATGTFPAASATSNVAVLPAATLAPGAYFLVAGGTSSSFGGPALPAFDASSNITASGTAGKVGLFATDGTTVLDLVAYGSSSTGGEGTPAPTLSTTLSAMRIPNGLDTNINSVDFQAGTPTPRALNSVPEPAALGLAAVGSALALRRRKSR